MKHSDKQHEAQWRDAELGARLRGLEVPEHAPDFFAALEERLETEGRDARAAHARGAARPRRNWLRLLWAPIPVAAVILLLLWALAGPLGIDFLQPQTASAAEIAQRAATAVADAQALRGTFFLALPAGYDVEGSGDGAGAEDLEEASWQFVCTAEGDFRMSGGIVSTDVAYDHESGVERYVYVGSGYADASERTGLATSLPDPAPSEGMLDRHLGAVVRALLESPQAAVSEETYEGRKVWVLSTDVQPNRLSTVSGDHLIVTVDQATGFPVKAVETKAGKRVREFRLEDLEVDPELPAGTFILDFPTSVRVTRTDYGFIRVEPARLKTEGSSLVGYTPVLPGKIPEGFGLTEVAVAAMGQGTGKEGMNPPAAGVVSAMYRRGFDRLVVTTRLVGADRSLWSDPLASGEGFIDTPEEVVLTAGPFAGSTAQILVDARAIPHLWVMSSTLVLTVSGDLTRDELLAAAESLTAAK